VTVREVEDHTTTTEISGALLSMARVLNQVRVHEAMCKRAGVQVDRGGAAVLYKLYVEGENVRITDLADRLGIDPPAVTRKVQQLERDGFVCRSVDPNDARASRLKLTRHGRSSIERLLRAREGWLGEVLSGWTRTDRRELARLLYLLASTLEQDVETRHGR
jgi:DNA-binding MarR family transcriptional regulator